MAPSWIRSAIGVFFEYDTPRIVHIRSKKVGVINRFIQLCILAYVIGFAIIYKKGYQDFDNVQSAVTTKLKGVAFTNTTDPNIGARVWDVTDYVVPPQENGAFFVTTNMIITPNQTQGKCPEDPNIPDACCDETPCVPGEPVIGGNGVKTGACVDPVLPLGPKSPNCAKVCEIYAWCPLENNTAPRPPVLTAFRNFTVFIKNNIEFPKFGIKRRNIPDGANDSYLQSCRYLTDKYCPIFQLGSIVAGAEADYEEVAAQGAVVQIAIRWDCNLDFSKSYCLPVYSFRRLDASSVEETQQVSPGFNFRYSHYYAENGVPTRTLVKAYGIRFIVSVEGQAGKFNFVPLMLNVGSGLALLSISTIVCDIVVLYILKARKFYQEKKYLNVKGDDAYETFSNEPDSVVRKRHSQGDVSNVSQERPPLED